jgi:hypothetical protein
MSHLRPVLEQLKCEKLLIKLYEKRINLLGISFVIFQASLMMDIYR